MNKKDIKEYKDAQLILEMSATPSSKGNKLLKIAVNTEDPKFKHLVSELAKGYSYFIRRFQSRTVKEGSEIPSNHAGWVEYMLPRKTALEDYIQNVALSYKPQWQIIAEQHGWKPSKDDSLDAIAYGLEADLMIADECATCSPSDKDNDYCTRSCGNFYLRGKQNED